LTGLNIVLMRSGWLLMKGVPWPYFVPISLQFVVIICRVYWHIVVVIVVVGIDWWW